MYIHPLETGKDRTAAEVPHRGRLAAWAVGGYPERELFGSRILVSID